MLQKPSTKQILIVLVCVVLIGLEYVFHGKLAGIIERIARSEIQKQKIDVSFESANYGYFPPRLILNKIKYKDQSLIVSADQLSLSAQLLPLIKGQLKADKLSISKSNISYKIPVKKDKISDDSPELELNLNQALKLIPIHQIQVIDSNAMLFLKDDIVKLEVEDSSLMKFSDRLQLNVKSIVKVRGFSVQEAFHLNTKLRWQESGFFLNYFTLQKENSIVQISGSFQKDIIKDFEFKPEKITDDIDELRLKINLDLAESNETIKTLLKGKISPKSPVQDFSGRVQVSGYYYKDASTEDDRSSINLDLDNIQSPFASLVQVSAKASLTKKSLLSDKISFKLSDKSDLSFESFKILKKQNAFFLSTNLKSNALRVEDIISSLNLRADGLNSPVALDANCGGSLSPTLQLKCNGNAELFGLKIDSPNNQNKIISTGNLKADFKSTVTDTNYSFRAEAEHKSQNTELVSKGIINGDIHFINGFDVNFETEPFDASFFKEISGQKFSGLTSLVGNTKGSSKWGEITARIQNEEFQFNDLYAGQNQFEMSYKFPNLSFTGIQGRVTEDSNDYRGAISLDVEDKKIAIDLRSKNMSDYGVRKVFEDMFTLPQDIKFDSSFKLSMGNSLDINSMDMTFLGSLTNLSLFGEKFNSGSLKIKGLNGNWSLNGSKLQKGDMTFTSEGSLNGFKEIDVKVTSGSFDLGKSTFLKEAGFDLSGPAQLSLNAKGPLQGPKATGSIRLQNTLGPRKNELGDSELDYRLYEDYISFSGKAFDESVDGEGKYPLKPSGKFAFKGKLNKFNVLDFTTINSQNAPDTKMIATLDSDFEVSNITKGISEGSVKNAKLEIQSENQSLFFMEQTDGEDLKKTLRFEIKQVGRNAVLDLDLENFRKPNISFSGALNLDFLKPFIPTCEFIQGEFRSDQIQIESKKNGFKASGDAVIKGVNFKTDTFPYSFNQLRSKVDFDGDTILFKEINASVSNTYVNGNGQILLKYGGSSLDFNFNHKGLKVEFPPKIVTVSSGRFNLSGDGFPFVLGGSLVIENGLFSKDVLASSSSETVTPSKWLPRKILKKATPPVELDLKVRIRDEMKIENNEADGYAYGFLTAKNNPTDPTLSGDIRLKPGLKINFSDKVFTLREGLLNYKNAYVNNPDIFIDANTSLIDNNDAAEQNYEIRMIIKGNALNPDVNFTSQPSLQDSQIVSLLTIGTISTESVGQEINATEQATYSGLQFGSYLMQKNQALKDLQKQTGTQIGVSSSVTAGGVNPTVQVKKSWNPRLSSTVSQSFGGQRSLSLKNEYKINQRTSTYIGIQNNQPDDGSQLNNRRAQEGNVLDLGLQYRFEFD